MTVDTGVRLCDATLEDIRALAELHVRTFRETHGGGPTYEFARPNGDRSLFGDAMSRSNGFYEAMGGRRLYAANAEFHSGYGWPDLTALSAICANPDGSGVASGGPETGVRRRVLTDGR
jgi:hypothetical protein